MQASPSTTTESPFRRWLAASSAATTQSLLSSSPTSSLGSLVRAATAVPSSPLDRALWAGTRRAAASSSTQPVFVESDSEDDSEDGDLFSVGGVDGYQLSPGAQALLRGVDFAPASDICVPDWDQQCLCTAVAFLLVAGDFARVHRVVALFADRSSPESGSAVSASPASHL